ncbi:hypothetical protein TRFO_05486 [Tritrichomonas foetus]|uniref:Uncharacterized protein n=1 Tax=Tritrichomonas foetus TaxID=1144522 RepID=A0A1J4KAQ1_9EUKA|nr:hypothetical protein TRFO_05486 [Tritrichomonas foetus]|eukprot:OHT06788.1 hypothetical protein TRFO_05486 [Tritrichomonas foetus]
MGKVLYIFVENLPKLVTKQDILKFFSEMNPQAPTVHLFLFRGRTYIYDLQSCILVYKNDSNDAFIENIQRQELIFNGNKLRITVRDEISDFQMTLVVFDIEEETFNRIYEKSLDKTAIHTTSHIITPSNQKLVGRIIRFRNTQKLEEGLNAFCGYPVKPLIDNPNVSFQLPKSTFKKIPEMSKLFDFHLIYFGKKYGLFKSISSKLSGAIDKCDTNEIILPDIEGPIEMIIDFLNLQEIVITPETERFLFAMATFLNIPDIIVKLSPKSQEMICISNAPSLTHIVPPESAQNLDLCTFLASNIEDLVNNPELADIPLYYTQKIIELSAPQLETHDSLLRLIMVANLETPIKRELLKMIDTKKVSPAALSIFLSSSLIDLNKIRDFISSVLFD